MSTWNYLSCYLGDTNIKMHRLKLSTPRAEKWLVLIYIVVLTLEILLSWTCMPSQSVVCGALCGEGIWHLYRWIKEGAPSDSQGAYVFRMSQSNAICQAFLQEACRLKDEKQSTRWSGSDSFPGETWWSVLVLKVIGKESFNFLSGCLYGVLLLL